MIRILKYIFHFSVLLLIIISLWPGSLLGFLFYNDWGQLDKGVIRIKRSGSGMLDTSYAISATARDMEIPDDKFEEQSDLPAVKEYFKDRYGSVTASVATSNGSTPSSEAVKLDELF